MARPAFVTGTPSTSFFSRAHKLNAVSRQTLGNRVARRTTRVRPVMRVYDVEIELYGEKYMIPIDEDQTLLEGIEEFGLEVLHSCRAGVCVTCSAKILAGDVDLGFASITDDLKDEGYVLTCSGYPRSEGIKLEMNHFDDVYNKQYGQYEQETQV